jgi:hypothetical protein
MVAESNRTIPNQFISHYRTLCVWPISTSFFHLCLRLATNIFRLCYCTKIVWRSWSSLRAMYSGHLPPQFTIIGKKVKLSL